MKQVLFSTDIDPQNQIQMKQSGHVYVILPFLMQLFVFFQSGIRIIRSQKKEKHIIGTETEIIRKIHALRYNDEHAYITTGGHFSQLYVRNLGIFLNALLDPRIPGTKEDWKQRQQIALRTVAVDLAVFSKTKKAYTTIVQLWKHGYSAMNIYTQPSDSLFGILYTLAALQDGHFIASLFPAQSRKQHILQTKPAAMQLLKNYHQTVIALLHDYKNSIIDAKTGLIRTDITLASARDGIKRQSSFYDNVVAWSTFSLAKKLQLVSLSEKEFAAWKKRIITTFWDESEGIFLDDVSESSKKEKKFCADSFIVTSSGFFDINNNVDRKRLKKMVLYVSKNGLDLPFPLRYSKKDELHKLYWPVRFGAPSYMGETIWSHWGMEYIKALILLGRQNEATKHLQAYKQRIEYYGGYPELYDTHGNVYTTRFYKSVLHNSWVINYEQATMLITHPNLPWRNKE